MKKGVAIAIIIGILLIAAAIYYFAQKTNKTIKKTTDKLSADVTSDVQTLAAKSGDIKDIFASADDITKNINSL